MIYIVTVHFKTNRWLPIQLKYLTANVPGPFQVYACCNGFTDACGLKDHGRVYSTDFRTHQGSENHAANLAFLADKVLAIAKPDDVLIFLDGDAFPIAPLPLETWLKEHKLVAVRRAEGPSPYIPHPSFCATTVRFWRDLPGSWNPNPCKLANGTFVSDTGSRLLQRLDTRRQAWLPLTRTNAYDVHKLCYGIYGNVVYHHGAGFRPQQVVITSSNLDPHTTYNAGMSVIIYDLIRRHTDFYKVFQDGTYRQEVEAAMRQLRLQGGLTQRG